MEWLYLTDRKMVLSVPDIVGFYAGEDCTYIILSNRMEIETKVPLQDIAEQIAKVSGFELSVNLVEQSKDYPNQALRVASTGDRRLKIARAVDLSQAETKGLKRLPVGAVVERVI